MNSEIWVRTVVFDALAWRPKRGDRVLTDPGTASERKFKISGVYPMTKGDVQITMNEVGENE